MKIAVDAAGKEPGHRVIIQGTLAAMEKSAQSGECFRPVLYGPGDHLRETLKEFGVPTGEVDVVDSPDVVEMSDRPADVIRYKERSSIVRAMKDLAEGVVRSFVSMGNTGAIVGAARMELGRIRWISRPALGVPLPRADGMGMLLDAGASMSPKPNHLVQYAAMGSAFVEQVYAVENPRVGLLNIGSESNKGDEVSQDAFRLLSKAPLNFVGNIEGGDLLKDSADVIVTNGFVGNVLLKFIESIPEFLASRFSNDGNLLSMLRGLTDLDHRRWGGATLLGVDGTVVIGHGSSQAEAITQALLWAKKMIETNLTLVLRDKVFKVRKSLWLSNPFSRGDGSDDEF